VQGIIKMLCTCVVCILFYMFDVHLCEQDLNLVKGVCVCVTLV
jgi:hypothetical protein